MGVVASMALAWFAMGGYLLLRLIVAVAAGGLQTVRGAWKRWTASVAIVVATIGLLFTSAPLLVRFNLSQAEMDQVAREALATSEPFEVERVGLFPVQRVERFDGGVRLVVNECMVDLCGFAFSSEGKPPNLGGEDTYHHLDGNWFLWEESW